MDKVLDSWYPDDGYLTGHEADVLTAFDSLRVPLASIGQQINDNKCNLWAQSISPKETAGLKRVDSTNAARPLAVLGFPVAGSEEAMVRFAEEAVQRAVETSGAISKLNHAQGEATILRACGPTARLRHLLRSDAMTDVVVHLFEADEATLRHAARIIGRPLPTGWETVASLPIGEGGLGFELVRNIDQRALSSSARDSICRTLDQVAAEEPNEVAEIRISSLVDIIRQFPLPAERLPMAIMSGNDGVSDSSAWLRRTSACAPHASAYLLAGPGPDTTMTDNEYRDALWIRLGLPAPVGHTQCSPSPTEDPLGHHRLGCKAAACSRLRRHDCLVAVLAKCALAADSRSFRVQREERPPDGVSLQRPGDLALNMGDGRTLVDVTVVNSSGARLTTAITAGSPAVAAETAYSKKAAKYASHFQSGDLTRFVPLAVTALGVWDQRSLRWLRTFSDVCASANSINQGVYFASLMTQLSISLWRGNSWMLRACREKQQQAEEPDYEPKNSDTDF